VAVGKKQIMTELRPDLQVVEELKKRSEIAEVPDAGAGVGSV